MSAPRPLLPPRLVALLLLLPQHGAVRLDLTPGAALRGDLLVGLPLSLLLPAIGYNTEYKWRWREGRVLAQAGEPGHHDEHDQDQEDGTADPRTGPLLVRIDALFHYLGVHHRPCRLRAICEIVQSNLKFSPLGDYLSSLFRESKSSFLDDEGTPSVRWAEYHAAGQAGASAGCLRYTGACDLNVEQMVNLPALQLWQLAAEKVSLRIDDF